MPATMPKPLKRKDIRITVQPAQRSDATGAYSSTGSLFTVTGRGAAVNLQDTTEWERTDADDASGADRDWTKDDWTLVIEGLKLITGSAGDLEDIKQQYKYAEIKVEWNRAGVNRPKYYLGGIQDLNFESALGRMVDRMTLVRVGTDGANPSTSSQL